MTLIIQQSGFEILKEGGAKINLMCDIKRNDDVSHCEQNM